MSEKNYRVISKTYTNRIEFEDGPGSLQNIVSDVTKKVLWEWSEPSDTPINEVTRYAQKFVPCIYGDDGPWVECSYRLEFKDRNSGEWMFLDSLVPRVVGDDCDEYSDSQKEYQDYCDYEESHDEKL